MVNLMKLVTEQPNAAGSATVAGQSLGGGLAIIAGSRAALVCRLCGGLNGPRRWSKVRRSDRRGCSRKHCRATVFDRDPESGLES
jgi:fermentation-respiration switch protein FrsA (DUF1100 family)